MAFNMIQWNGQSVHANKASLEMYLALFSPKIVFLSETWFKPGYKFKNYYTVHCDRVDGYGGSSILVSGDINFTNINLTHLSDDNIQLCAVRAQLDHEIDLVSIYVAPRISTTDLFWNRLIAALSPQFIIAGEFNAHGIPWDCSYTDRYRVRILDGLDLHDLVIQTAHLTKSSGS